MSIAGETANGLRGIAIPLQRETLLLPNTAVADIVGDRELERQEGAPDWVAGVTDWQRRRLVVVQFERLLGQIGKAVSQRRRIVVCYTLDEQARDPFIGIMSMSIPRLVRIEEEQLQGEAMSPALADAPVLAALRFAGQHALIPDLAGLERRLRDGS